MKPKILFAYMAYPFAIASYFRQAFERRQDIDLWTCGAYTGDWIPWGAGMRLPPRYVYPVNLALPVDAIFPSWSLVRAQLDFTPDVVIQVDANWHFRDRPQVEKVITVATDPHVLNYDLPRGYSDYFFNMQAFYSISEDMYLPYAADQHHHYPTNTDGFEYDASLIGLHYRQRDDLVNGLRSAGFTVNYDLGLIYDEYREANNKARVGLNWSSLQDLPARVFEVMAMKMVCLTNRVPDLGLHFEEGKHYLGFSTVQEAVEKMGWIKNNPDKVTQIAQSAYELVVDQHTYDIRVDTILKTAGVI